MTSAAASVFALVVMGNMVGDGHDLPSWVHIEERQEFLYFSDRTHTSNLFIGFGMAFLLLGLVFARGRIWKALFQAARYAHESSQVSAVSEAQRLTERCRNLQTLGSLPSPSPEIHGMIWGVIGLAHL